MYATGVVGFFFASTSSMILGSPEVATVDSIPARWKDLRIIWVPGSPTDCAAIMPTGSPYSTKYLLPEFVLAIFSLVVLCLHFCELNEYRAYQIPSIYRLYEVVACVPYAVVLAY